ncbi:maleylpyruvate isomerase family mycothiol-dependent enzyme [Nonomuraea sp. NPDC050556]|uniref:maleylpyruvate isomerase family mycothiol-dependent enzyme n=1 Tax=Nonomuraea sp. NPDC050556 TaxID=3364369 RepID=UPI0037B424F8
MDYVPHFQREVQAFTTVIRTVAQSGEAPMVPSCPEWSMADLALHLGMVHRYVTHVIRERSSTAPEHDDPSIYNPPADRTGWPIPGQTPHRGPLPTALVDYCVEGAATLTSVFATTDPSEKVWTWSPEQTVGFWLRMQTIEAAIHRWDAENTITPPTPIHPELAADAVTQTFEVMAPARRIWTQAPPGDGERYIFRQTDGPSTWTVTFDGPDVHMSVSSGVDRPASPGGAEVALAGTASDLMLVLWHRLPAEQLEVSGDKALVERYFVLVPPV